MNQLQTSLSDFAVSSYTPTLGALLNTLHSRGKSINPPALKLLAVIQPATPGQTPLPGTKEELKAIEKHAKNYDICKLIGTQAGVKEVLSAMMENSWVHLACHGKQDIEDPQKSGLFLHDDVLHLSDIIKNPLPHADFAFLSACQTATGDQKYPDEAIHLAAGMLLAGYDSVIATMWSIQDNDAPRVANDVYHYLLKDEKPKSMHAAKALHIAIQKLQKQHQGGSFISWVPFIHVGL